MSHESPSRAVQSPTPSHRAQGWSRQGGEVARATAARSTPAIRRDFLDFLDAVGRSGPTRQAWRTFWKAADGLPLDPDELTIYRQHTGRRKPPTRPAREVWCISGRRSGKSENVVLRETWRAIARDWTRLLAPGETGIIPIVAADREQAGTRWPT